MSNPYQARVLQKLSHCRLLMQQLTQWDQFDRQGQEALMQGAVVHLATACRLYLREIAYALNVVQAEAIFTPADLVNAAPKGLGVAEIATQDWITELLAAERGILNPPLVPHRDKVGRDEVSSPQIIAVDSVAQPLGEVTGEILHRWCKAFEALSERQRESFVEY